MGDEHNTVLNVLQHIDMYYKPILLCLFLLGNGLSVYVLLCTKLCYKKSYNIYLAALAISDSGVLVTVFINWLTEKKILGFVYWLHVLKGGMQLSFSFLSVWIVVTFTVQRYIVIKWPLHSRSLCIVNRPKIVLIGLTLLGILYSMPLFGLHGYIKLGMVRTKKEMKNLIFFTRILLIIHAFAIFVLPATIIVIFNILIIYIIRKQNRIRGNMILSFAASNDKTLNSSDERSHIKTTKMLVIISSIFVFLNVPVQVCYFFIGYGVRINIYC